MNDEIRRIKERLLLMIDGEVYTDKQASEVIDKLMAQARKAERAKHFNPDKPDIGFAKRHTKYECCVCNSCMNEIEAPLKAQLADMRRIENILRNGNQEIIDHHTKLQEEHEQLRKQLTSYKRAGKDYLKLLEECEQLKAQLADIKDKQIYALMRERLSMINGLKRLEEIKAQARHQVLDDINAEIKTFEDKGNLTDDGEHIGDFEQEDVFKFLENLHKIIAKHTEGKKE